MQPKWSWIHHMLPHQMSLQPWCQSHSVGQLEMVKESSCQEDTYSPKETGLHLKTEFIPQQSSLFVSVTPDTVVNPSRSTTSHPGSKTLGSVWLQVFWFQIGLASPSTALEAAPPHPLVVLWYAGLLRARLGAEVEVNIYFKDELTIFCRWLCKCRKRMFENVEIICIIPTSGWTKHNDQRTFALSFSAYIIDPGPQVNPDCLTTRKVLVNRWNQTWPSLQNHQKYNSLSPWFLVSESCAVANEALPAQTSSSQMVRIPGFLRLTATYLPKTGANCMFLLSPAPSAPDTDAAKVKLDPSYVASSNEYPTMMSKSANLSAEKGAIQKCWEQNRFCELNLLANLVEQQSTYHSNLLCLSV